MSSPTPRRRSKKQDSYSPRRRGAQPGNTNRLSHGAYSKHISVELRDELDSMPADRNHDELALARSRLLACIEHQDVASGAQWLSFDHAVIQYFQVISRLTHHNAVLGRDSKGSLITVLEMIRQVNEKDHVA